MFNTGWMYQREELTFKDLLAQSKKEEARLSKEQKKREKEAAAAAKAEANEKRKLESRLAKAGRKPASLENNGSELFYFRSPVVPHI